MQRVVRPLREIFGPQKAFHGWVGDPRLNRLGLHSSRIALSDGCVALRRATLRSSLDRRWRAAFARDGILVIPDFLESAVFEAVRSEVRELFDTLERRHPKPKNTIERGFGAKRPFAGGLDRFDGATLNRFALIDRATTPTTHRALRDERLRALCEYTSGFRFRPERFSASLTVHGDERENPDVQKTLHRDTFHSTVKAWLFLEEVAIEQGPFAYVPGSQRMDLARHRWERQRALAAIGGDVLSRGGSFRIDDAELAALGLPQARPYPVSGNTLVLADVRGFHRRSAGLPGAERVALYGNFRRSPFAPVAY